MDIIALFSKMTNNFLEILFRMENKELVENIIKNAYKEFSNNHSYKSTFQLKNFFKN